MPSVPPSPFSVVEPWLAVSVFASVRPFRRLHHDSPYPIPGSIPASSLSFTADPVPLSCLSHLGRRLVLFDLWSHLFRRGHVLSHPMKNHHQFRSLFVKDLFFSPLPFIDRPLIFFHLETVVEEPGRRGDRGSDCIGIRSGLSFQRWT